MAGIKMVTQFNHFGPIAKQLPVSTKVITHKHSENIVQGCKRRSRVDTGEMRDGWHLEETRSGFQVVNDVEHTSYNEYGTRYMSAQPMLRPSVEEEREPFIADMRRLEDALR